MLSSFTTKRLAWKSKKDELSLLIHAKKRIFLVIAGTIKHIVRENFLCRVDREEKPICLISKL